MSTEITAEIVRRALEEDIKRVREQVIEKAVDEFEQELKRLFLHRAVDITKFYELETLRDSVIIKVYQP
jgi:hypothetical protein